MAGPAEARAVWVTGDRWQGAGGRALERGLADSEDKTRGAKARGSSADMDLTHSIVVIGT